LGYRKIGLAVPGQGDRYADGAFSAGYCLYEDMHGEGARIPRFVPREWAGGTPSAFKAWYREYRPEAVVCITDDVREWLAEEKIHAPQDVGLVHLNWSSRLGDCSGIWEHNEFTGAAAAQLVMDQLHFNERGIPEYTKAVLIDGEWVRGETVRKIK
jgi:LacI family transcriptional regulator